MYKSIAILPFLVATAFAGEILAGVVPLPQHTQEQNTATGEYGFSYSGGPSAKTEFRALDGTTTGAYSYVDANGILQSVNYIADEFGFRAAGTNIPSDGLTPLDAPDVAAAKAAHFAEHARATAGLRKKRGIYAAAPVLPIAHALPLATSSQSRVQIHRGAHLIHQQPIYAPAHALLLRKRRGLAYAAAPLYHTATLTQHLPTASSSQNRFQIHKDAHIIEQHPIYAPAHALLLRKRRSLAYAAPLYHTTTYTQHLPTASSSQNRFQIHKDAKIIQEYHEPIYAAAPVAPIVEAKAALAVPAAPIVEAKVAVPATPIIEQLPYSSSSQSRFQIHNNAKIIQEYHEPIYAAAPVAVAPAAPIVEAKAAVAVAPAAPIVEAKAAVPVVPATPIVEHLPYSSSSQNRFQIHKSAKIIQEYHEPLYATAPVAVAPAAPIVEAKAAVVPATPVIEQLPYSSSSQNRFQIHSGGKIIQEYHQPLYAAAPVAIAAPAVPVAAEPALAAIPTNEYLPSNDYLPAKAEYPSGPSGPAPAAPSAPAAGSAEASVSDDAISVESA